MGKTCNEMRHPHNRNSVASSKDRMNNPPTLTNTHSTAGGLAAQEPSEEHFSHSLLRRKKIKYKKRKESECHGKGKHNNTNNRLVRHIITKLSSIALAAIFRLLLLLLKSYV